MQARLGLWVWSLGWEDALEEGMATHSSVLACRTPRTEEPGGLQSTGSQRAGQAWSTLALTLPPACGDEKPRVLQGTSSPTAQLAVSLQLRSSGGRGGNGGCFLNIPASPFSQQETPEHLADVYLVPALLPFPGDCSAAEATGTPGTLFLGSPRVSQLRTRSSQVSGEVLWKNTDAWQQACPAVGILAFLTWLSPLTGVKRCEEFLRFHRITVITPTSSLVDSSFTCSSAGDKLSCGSHTFCRGFAAVGN